MVGPSRLEAQLRAARAAGRKVLLPFLMGGYPDRETFRELVLAVAQAGAAAIEVGVPSSDPVLDGPVIREASLRAVAAGVDVDSLLQDLVAVREAGMELPLVLMSYLPPVLARGVERLAADLKRTRVEGVLVVDGRAKGRRNDLSAAFAHESVDLIRAVTPSTSDDDLARLLADARGFVYCVSVAGVTGEEPASPSVAAEVITRVRRHTDLPALVGFGVSGPQSARDLVAVADGVVVGTAVLRSIGGKTGREACDAARALVASVASAIWG